MILEKIYSEPAGLFQEIIFKKGVNFIYGKKDSKDSKKSLNGIGKSLILDIIDYCLCSNMSERLKLAQQKEALGLSQYSAVLEFRVGAAKYVIKRSFAKTSEITLTDQGEESTYTLAEAKKFLCDLIFRDSGYEGKYSNSWFRDLIAFFLKIQQWKKGDFVDPITYRDVKRYSGIKLLPFHLFFMGIDNTLSYKNVELKSTQNAKDSALVEVKKFIEETYELGDISEAVNELDRIRRETKSLEEKVRSFKLADQYENAEISSNELTSKIKALLYENYADRAKLKSYSESYQINIEFSSRQISKIYGELNEALGLQVKKTLDEAIAFKETLSKSRQEFLKEETAVLINAIRKRDAEITNLEKQRAEIFKFLEAKEAIKDLSEAYLQLSKKQERITDLSGKVGLHTALVKEQAELRAEDAKLYAEVVNFVEQIRPQESALRAIFNEIYNAIYTEYKDQAKFSIVANQKKDQKIDINITFPSYLSKGKNNGRTLIYDLTLLINAIRSQAHLPRFLIHDGVFDGMDPAHFVHLYQYVENIAKDVDLQYIVTLNEGGVLSDEKFGDGAEELTSQRIEEEAILTLTPEKKLFGGDF